MAYRDDILALNPDHLWELGSSYTDLAGGLNATNTGMTTGIAITEDDTNSAQSNGTGDRIVIPNAPEINTFSLAQKAVGGWFRTDSIQTPPKRIWGEGDSPAVFQFMMAYGNNVMFEIVDDNASYVQQIFGPVLQPNRTYHLWALFEGNGSNNLISFYVDGVLQLNASPADRQPDTALLSPRTIVEMGDPAGASSVGGDSVLLNAAVNGFYKYWGTWEGADAILTALEVRQELFEKGALPDLTISSGTESTMQTSLDAQADSVRSDSALCIRVEAVTGDGNVTLNADNITFDEKASIHVQYRGTGVLTWRNTNGSNAEIGSTPNGGTIIFALDQTLTVTVLDEETKIPIEGARVRLTAAAGGDLTAGDVIMSEVTNASGVATTSFDFTNDQPFSGRVRKSSSSPFYKTSKVAGTLLVNPLDQTILMVGDE